MTEKKIIFSRKEETIEFPLTFVDDVIQVVQNRPDITQTSNGRKGRQSKVERNSKCLINGALGCRFLFGFSSRLLLFSPRLLERPLSGLVCIQLGPNFIDGRVGEVNVQVKISIQPWGFFSVHPIEVRGQVVVHHRPPLRPRLLVMICNLVTHWLWDAHCFYAMFILM